MDYSFSVLLSSEPRVTKEWESLSWSLAAVDGVSFGAASLKPRVYFFPFASLYLHVVIVTIKRPALPVAFKKKRGRGGEKKKGALQMYENSGGM